VVVQLFFEFGQPPRLRLRRSHPSCPGGAMSLNHQIALKLIQGCNALYDYLRVCIYFCG
jgi:hypothetical protein